MSTTACASCGALVDAAARYCPNCGSARLRPGPSGPSLQVRSDQVGQTSDERRIVTVLFADLTGSTPLGERLDPEDLRGVLERFFGTLAREVLTLDGTVDKYVGDEIMAVFGAPLAHEDDAVRAVSAAVAMQQAMAGLNASVGAVPGSELALRVGINTGEVVSGILAGQVQAAYTVVGDTVNTAKRVQSAARPGEIIVTEGTRQATARFFEFEAAGAVTAKGKAVPVPIYRYRRVVDPERASAGPPRMVGRAHERDVLVGAIARVSEGSGGVVAIVGEPGIGKTRLLSQADAAARTSSVTLLHGQASANGQTMGYLPFREMLRSWVGIEATEADDLKWSKLVKKLGTVLPDHADDILPYLGATLGLTLPESAARRVAELDGDAMRRQVLRSVYLLFEGMASAGPTIVALEDFQWVDRSSEQLLEHLLPLSDRLLFIWTGRPEPNNAVERMKASSRGLARGRYEELALVPLNGDETTVLVCEILKTKTLPVGLYDAVVRRAEGNPFYAEEILRAFQDLQALTRQESDGDWVLSSRRETGTLPTTVQGLIAARIDRLSEGAREIARLASVIGRTFSYRMIVTLDSAQRDVARCLEELEAQGLIRGLHSGERSYAFAHALVQETAYAGVLVRRRRELHARVAAATELLFAERIEEQYGVLAYHYAQAEQWDKAQDYLFKVGDQALRIAADSEAVDHYERALEAYGRAFGERWDPFERAAVERKIGEARYRLGEFERATRQFDRALELLGFPRPRSRTGVRVAIAAEILRQAVHRIAPAVSWGARRRPPEVSEAALQALWFHQFIDYSNDLERLLYDILRSLNIAERAAPSHRTLRSYFGMTLMCHNVGLRGMGGRYARMARDLAPQVGGTLADALASASTGLDHLAYGRWDPAMKDIGRAVDGYLAAGELEPWAAILTYLHIMLVSRGRLMDALPMGGDVERTGRAARDRRMEAMGPSLRAHVLFWAGRDAEAVAEYERSLAQHRANGDPHFAIPVAGALAQVHLRAGRIGEARTLVDESVRLARQHRLAGWWLTWILAPQADVLLREAGAATGPQRAALLAEAGRTCAALRKQGRLHYDALAVAHRHRGSLEWLLGHRDRARREWDRALEVASNLGAVTEEWETRETIARYTGSATERAAADTIALRLRTVVV